MFRFMFARQNINNNVLSSQKAMPLKDNATTNDSDFSIPRHQYVETVTSQPVAEKKWIGGNRDASQIIANRRIHSLGNGSLNAAKNPMSFTCSSDTNTVRQAKKRVRSGGSTVPAKVIHKYNNPPVFY
jgi:hypothetical protein